jgi:coenzyme F420-dependent glucose-6-phosphate dehydrogenase
LGVYLVQTISTRGVSDREKVVMHGQQHVVWLQQYIELGFEVISLHNVNREQRRFIEVFGEKVLPVVAGERQVVLQA